jgi:hypothetical protein
LYLQQRPTLHAHPLLPVQAGCERLVWAGWIPGEYWEAVQWATHEVCTQMNWVTRYVTANHPSFETGNVTRRATARYDTEATTHRCEPLFAGWIAGTTNDVGDATTSRTGRASALRAAVLVGWITGGGSLQQARGCHDDNERPWWHTTGEGGIVPYTVAYFCVV